MQVITEYRDKEIDKVLTVTERMDAHLTAAVVSNDVLFFNKVLANTVNGTTYAGLRARTTGNAACSLGQGHVEDPPHVEDAPLVTWQLLACPDHTKGCSSLQPCACARSQQSAD